MTPPAAAPPEPTEAELAAQEKARVETLPRRRTRERKAKRDRAARSGCYRIGRRVRSALFWADLTEHPGEEVEVTRSHRYPKPYSPMPPSKPDPESRRRGRAEAAE